MTTDMNPAEEMPPYDDFDEEGMDDVDELDEKEKEEIDEDDVDDDDDDSAFEDEKEEFKDGEIKKKNYKEEDLKNAPNPEQCNNQ